MRPPPSERVVRFDAFTLDLSRCVLLRGTAEVPLRRQAFDMLCYLAENRGRLVTKEELVKAIWRKVAVSDDSLVRCVRDIREALGDKDHRIIETVRGRGYLLATDAVAAEGWAPGQSTEARRHPRSGTWAQVDVGRRHLPSARWRGAAVLLAAGVTAAAGVWSLQAPPVAASAAHYAILGRNVLASERSARANREALAHFAKALALDPNWVPALLGYADVLVIQVGGEWVPLDERPARLDQAEAATERALGREPANAHAHHLKGVLLRMRGRPDRAMTAFEHSLMLNPDRAWTHAEFARTKIDLGRAEEALADIETALRLHPSEVAIHVWYRWAGMAALHAGKNEDALHWLLKAREARPSHPAPIPLLAVAYAETGREAEGRALIAEHLPRAPALTMRTFQRDYPPHNPIVAKQRERIAHVLRRLGVPEGRVQTGSVH